MTRDEIERGLLIDLADTKAMAKEVERLNGGRHLDVYHRNVAVGLEMALEIVQGQRNPANPKPRAVSKPCLV